MKFKLDPSCALVAIPLGLTITLFGFLIIPGCWAPPDDDQLIDVVDGIIKVKHTLSKEDTPGTAAGHLASTAYTLAFKYPDALRIEYTIYWPSLGYDQSTGTVSVNTPEIILLRQIDSASTYKQDRVKDYKVAIYEACTPLALKCTADQIHEIIKYRRSAAYHDGISGISNVEIPQIRQKQTVTNAEMLEGSKIVDELAEAYPNLAGAISDVGISADGATRMLSKMNKALLDNNIAMYEKKLKDANFRLAELQQSSIRATPEEVDSQLQKIRKLNPGARYAFAAKERQYEEIKRDTAALPEAREEIRRLEEAIANLQDVKNQSAQNPDGLVGKVDLKKNADLILRLRELKISALVGPEMSDGYPIVSGLGNMPFRLYQRAAYTQAVSNIIAAEIISQAIDRLSMSFDPSIEPEPTPFGPDMWPPPLEREE